MGNLLKAGKLLLDLTTGDKYIAAGKTVLAGGAIKYKKAGKVLLDDSGQPVYVKAGKMYLNIPGKLLGSPGKLLGSPEITSSGKIYMAGWQNASTSPIYLPDYNGVIREIPANAVPLVDPATGRTPRVVDIGGGDIEYYATDASGSPLPSYGNWAIAYYPGATNKCTNTNFNPTDTSGITMGGDAAAVLSVVDDSANLTDELQNLSNGQVYKLDNTAGGEPALVVIDGTTGNTNPHSLSVWARTVGTASNNGLGLDGFAGHVDFTKNAAYQRYSSTNVPPLSVYSRLTLLCQPGDVIYFVGNQLEESTFITPVIPVSGASATRDARSIRQPSSGTYSATEGVAAIVVTLTENLVDIWGGQYLGPDPGATMLYSNGSSNGVYSYDETAATGLNLPAPQKGKSYVLVLRWSTSANEQQVVARELGTSTWLVSGKASYDGAYKDTGYMQILARGDQTKYSKFVEILNKDLTVDEIKARYALGTVD